jgi:hypothetical protein
MASGPETKEHEAEQSGTERGARELERAKEAERSRMKVHYVNIRVPSSGHGGNRAAIAGRMSLSAPLEPPRSNE